MKTLLFIMGLLTALTVAYGFVRKENRPIADDPNTGDVYSIVGDQVARPGVNVVFIAPVEKDKFNGTQPSGMGAAFQPALQAKLMALNPDYTKNHLGLDATQFSSVLATDVLNVSMRGKTTFYDGTNVLTGRALEDDVIDVSLRLIFGGPGGKEKSSLTSDHVDHNDKPFLSKFPYEAEPW